MIKKRVAFHTEMRLAFLPFKREKFLMNNALAVYLKIRRKIG